MIRQFGRRNKEVDAHELRVLQASIPAPSGGVDHGRLTGLSDDDHAQYLHLSAGRTITAQHQFAPASPQPAFTLGANAQGQLVTGLKADQLNKSITAGNGLTGGGALTSNVSLSVLLPANSGLVVDASGVRIGSPIGSSLVPSATDTYDLGSSTKLWNKGWLSEIDAVLFAANTATLLGGWFIVSKDAGTIVGDVGTADTSVDFGKAMTQNDFVLFRAAGQTEYMQVGTLVAGNRYNVTRNLNSGSHSWVSGTPFSVLGYNGTGRIELYAYDTSGVSKPSISIFEQGTLYNSQTERLRLGDMYNAFGAGADHRYGIGIGDYAGGNYLSYNAEEANTFRLKAGGGGITIDAQGITARVGTSANYPSSYNIVDTNDAHVGGLSYFTDTLHDRIEGDIYCNGYNAGRGASLWIYAHGAASHQGELFLRASNPSGITDMVLKSDPAGVTSIEMWASRINIPVAGAPIYFGDGLGNFDTRIYRAWGACLRTDSMLFMDNWGVEVNADSGAAYRVYKNSTGYTGYIYVPLQMPATSGNWNGGAKNNTTDRRIIDLSAEFGLPPGIKGVVARLEHNDATAGAYACLGPTSSYSACLVTLTQVANRIATDSGVIACDNNGDIYFYDSEAIDSVKIEIWGYFI